MVYRAVSVSNNILMRAERDSVQVSPLKLQKILYFVASLYGRDTNNDLLDESFEAWQYGPVIRSVYHEFQRFGGSDITGRYASDAGQSMIADENNDNDLRRALDRAWEATKLLSPSKLVNLTHVRDSAWSKAWDENQSLINSSDVKSDRTYDSTLGFAR